MPYFAYLFQQMTRDLFSPLCFIAYCLIAVGLSTSRPVISIGQGLVVGLGLWAMLRHKRWTKPNLLTWGFAALFALGLFSGFYSEDKASWSNIVRIQLPFLLFPFFAAQLPPLSHKQFSVLSLLFILTQTVVSAGSFVLYFARYPDAWTHIRQQIETNGTIEFFTHIHHIYLGLFLAFSVLLATYWALKTEGTLRWIYSLLALCNFLLVHLITSRTGFFSLYIGLMVTAVYYLISQRKIVLGVTLMGVCVGLIIFAMKFVPTVKSRLEIMRWELNEFYVNKNMTDGSLSKRILAWEAVREVAGRHFWLGIGVGDVRRAILEGSKQNMKRFERVAPDMNEDLLLDSPHNQFMENLLGTGIMGVLLLVAVLLYPLCLQPRNALLGCFVAMLAASMLTESFLVRQWGVAFLLFFYALFGLFHQPAKE